MKKAKPISPLSAVHQRRTRFVKEFLIDQNATRAAQAAGFSEKTAYSQGQRLLKNVDVRLAIEQGNAKVNAKLDITVERVKLELARLAFFDPRAFWNEDGTAKKITDLDEDTARALAGFEAAELFSGSGEERAAVGYIKKFKLADKGANLERLGKHLQMFPTKVEVSGTLEVQKTDDADLSKRIADLERDLGLARAIDEAGRTGGAQAGTGTPAVKAKDTPVLSR